MNQPEAIRTEARDVLVVHEVLTRLVGQVSFKPVSPDGEHCTGIFNYRDDVGPLDGGGVAVLVLVLVARDAQLDVDLQQQKSVVMGGGEPRLLILALLDLINVLAGLTDVDVAVEPGVLKA